MKPFGWILVLIFMAAEALAQGGTGTGSGAYNTGGVMGSSSGSTGATYGGTGGSTSGSSTAAGAPAGTATAGGTVGATGLRAQPGTQMAPTSLPSTPLDPLGGALGLSSPSPSPSPLISIPQSGGLLQ